MHNIGASHCLFQYQKTMQFDSPVNSCIRLLTFSFSNAQIDEATARSSIGRW